MQKSKTIQDLAKWPLDTEVYWIVLRSIDAGNYELREDELWMTEVHPKVLYDRKVLPNVWNSKIKLPKLHALDFNDTLDMLCSQFVVEKFKITKLYRCPNTGECIYCSEFDEWMPESMLFEDEKSAIKEVQRIKRLFKRWIELY